VISDSAWSELLQRVVEMPLQSEVDQSNKCFLKCEMNRYGTSYRSPHSNLFVPEIMSADEPPILSDKLRTLELHANEIWDSYTKLYYGKEAIGSVYLKESSSKSFVACFLISKTVQNDERLEAGQWNSAHIVQVGKIMNGTSCNYKIQSQIMISLNPRSHIGISGQLSRTTEQTHSVSSDALSASHLENIGKMIEDIEIDMRSNLDVVTIPRTRQVLSGLRRPTDAPDSTNKNSHSTMKMGIPIMPSFRQRGNKNPQASGVMLPGMAGGGEASAAHAAALQAAIFKRATKKA
jgi:capping protein (actin filament) muscle Z-line, beta